jgi:hypothetical protein
MIIPPLSTPKQHKKLESFMVDVTRLTRDERLAESFSNPNSQFLVLK